MPAAALTPDEITTLAIGEGAAQKPAEFTQLAALVLERRPRSVLEIGTMSGGTLKAWCELATDDALIVSVDLPGGEWGGGYKDADVPHLHGFTRAGQQLVLIRGDSHQPDIHARAADAFDGPVDLLFIDGDHTYQGVAQDFTDYSPLVTKGGLIVFHDILPHPEVPRCEVPRFWRDIADDHPTWEFCIEGDERGYGPWGGIGVLEWD